MQPALFRAGTLMTLLVLVCACASIPPSQNQPSDILPAQNILGQTDDLGLVADLALQQAERFGTDRVLVIFDIDNTLLAMEQELGSDQWYDWQKELQKEDPCSDMLVSNRLAVQGALFFASAMRPTQPDAAEQVQRLQDEFGVYLVGSSRISLAAIAPNNADYLAQSIAEVL